MDYFEKMSFLITVEIFFLIIDLMKKYGKYHSFLVVFYVHMIYFLAYFIYFWQLKQISKFRILPSKFSICSFKIWCGNTVRVERSKQINFSENYALIGLIQTVFDLQKKFWTQLD